jgi:hypothetical protein
MPKSIWDLLQGQFSPGLPAVNNFVEGLLAPRPVDPNAGEVVHKTANPLTDITKGDIDRATDVGMAFSGGGLATKIIKPPVIGGYHGTLKEFEEFRPPTNNAGVHFTTNPEIAKWYSTGIPKRPVYDIGSQTMPVVADIANPLNLGEHAVHTRSWRDPLDVATAFSNADRANMLPKGLLADVQAARKTVDLDDWTGFANKYFGILKDRGYDAVQYMHSGKSNKSKLPDSYMALDPEQVVPRLSSKGQSLIAERGVIEPEKFLDWKESQRKSLMKKFKKYGE